MEPAAPNPPKRRRLNVSVRVLMLLVLAAGVWMGRQIGKAREQRDAVAAVREYGGTVHYDWEFPKGEIGGTHPRAPRWLRRLLGDEYVQEVVQVDLVYGRSGENPNLSPADPLIERLAVLPRLRRLSLTGPQATDEGLRQLRLLPSLGQLYLYRATELSDDALANLASLPHLKVLVIGDSHLSDRGLAHLARVRTLEKLMLSLNGRFTDAGLAHLTGLTSLDLLSVGGCPRVTDAGLVHLKTLKNLEILDLQGTGVTDAGLEHLAGLTKLKELGVGQTAISPQGKASFQAAMPNLKVIR